MPGPLESAGALPEPSEYATLSMDRHITGLWTQRSPLRDADVSYLYTKFWSASRFDSLIDGINREITAKLTDARRAGTSVYNNNTFPAIYSYYSYKSIVNGIEVIRVIADGKDGWIYDATAGQQTKLLQKPVATNKARFLGLITELLVSDGATLQSKISWQSGSPVVSPWGGAGPTVAPTVTNVPLPASYPAWIPNAYYSPPGTFLIVDPAGNIQSLTTSGTTGGSQPSWNPALNGKTNDGTCQWTNVGPAAWQASHPYALGAFMHRSWTEVIYLGVFHNEQQFRYISRTSSFQVVIAGTSGVGPPTLLAPDGSTQEAWGSGNNSLTIDGGSDLEEHRKCTRLARGQCTVIEVVSQILDSNGYLQTVSSSGQTGAAAPSWSKTVGEQTTDFGVTWQNAGAVAAGGTGAWLYCYSFKSSVTKDVTTASPLSQPIVLAPNSFIQVQGLCSTDPQYDLIEIYRTAMGQATPVLLADIPNSPLQPSTKQATIAQIMVTNQESRLTRPAPFLQLIFTANPSPFSDGPLVTLVGLTTHPTLNGATVSQTTTTPSFSQFSFVSTPSGIPANDSAFLPETGTATSVLNNNPGSIWTYNDTSGSDSVLTPQVPAPINNANDPPPAGITAMAYHCGRVWGIVGNNIVYSGGPDTLVGNGNHTFPPLNTIPVPELAVRLFPGVSNQGATLFIWGVANIYSVFGDGGNTMFGPAVLYLADVGILSYDAVALFGTNYYAFTGKKKAVMLDTGSGDIEIGFPIGDQFSKVTTGAGSAPVGKLYDPASTYVTFNEESSGDTAMYVSDGTVGWFRYSPVTSPESGFLWSPRAAIQGGTSAVQGVEVSPGISHLLIGPASSGPILFRDPTVNADWTAGAYQPFPAWDVKGNIVLCQSGQVAEIAHIGLKSAAVGARPLVGLLLGEISATQHTPFDQLSITSSDPPDLPPSETLYSDRYTALQNGVCPKCDNFQMKVDYGVQNVPDELIMFSIYGAKHAERKQQ